MTTHLNVVDPGPSNSVRMDSHPILESGNLAYPNGRYRLAVDQADSRESLIITHQVVEAPLIENFIDRGVAKYGCIVSSPLSSYRRTHLSCSARQTIEWRRDDLGEPPMFTPMVLCTEPVSVVLDSDKHGVHKIWHGKAVQLRKGARMALGDVFRFEASVAHLISMHEDKSLSSGQFYVEAKTEPFGFVVRLHPDLHRFIKRDRGCHRDTIIVHIVTACFSLLQRDYGNNPDSEGWESYSNLKALAGHLEENEFPHWGSEDFHPEKVATGLYGLTIPNSEGKDE